MGGTGEDLATVGLAIADGFAQQAINRQNRRAQTELATTSQVFGELAQRGQLGNIDPQVLKAAERRLGKTAVETLMFQSSVNEPLATFREGALAQIQEPVESARQVGTREVQAQGPPTAEGQVPTQTVPLFARRAASPQEQFQRLEAASPLAVGLIGGQNLGALQASSLRSLAQQRTTSSAERRQIRGVLINLATNNRLVGAVPTAQFDPGQLQPGQDVLTLGDTSIVFRKRGTPQFANLNAERSALAQELNLSAEEAETVEGARAIADLKAQKELDKAQRSARQKADIEVMTFNQQPLAVTIPNHRLYDNQSGNRIRSTTQTQEAFESPTTVELTGQQERTLNDLKQGVSFVNQIAELVARVYGVGGIFEGLAPEGRLSAAARGELARRLQTDPDLAQLANVLRGRLPALLRASGQVGSLSDRDVQNGLSLLARVEGIPDTAEQAFRSVEALYDFFGERAGTILQNDRFQFQGQIDVRERARDGLGGSGLSATDIPSPTQAEAIGNNLGLPADIVEQMKQEAASGRFTVQQMMEAAQILMQQRTQGGNP